MTTAGRESAPVGLAILQLELNMQLGDSVTNLVENGPLIHREDGGLVQEILPTFAAHLDRAPVAPTRGPRDRPHRTKMRRRPPRA